MFWQFLQISGYFRFEDLIPELKPDSIERDLRLMVAAEWSVPWELTQSDLPVPVTSKEVNWAKRYAYCPMGDIDACFKRVRKARRWDLFAYPGDMRKSYLLRIRLKDISEKFQERVYVPMHKYYKKNPEFDDQSKSLALRASTWLAKAELFRHGRDATLENVSEFLMDTVGPAPTADPEDELTPSM